MKHAQLKKLGALARIKSDQALAELAALKGREARLLEAGANLDRAEQAARRDALDDPRAGAALAHFERYVAHERKALAQKLTSLRQEIAASHARAARDFGRSTVLDKLQAAQ